MTNDIKTRVTEALTSVRNPRTNQDILTGGMVEDLVVSDQGKVSFTFVLDRNDPATLVRQANQVAGIKINVTFLQCVAKEFFVRCLGAGVTFELRFFGDFE